jgi:DNA adenine methylase
MKIGFGRVGGKNYLKNIIIKEFPKEYEIYVEPFCGACSLFFKKDKSKIEILNDKDKNIYEILNLLKSKSVWVDEHINRNITKEYFQRIKDSKEPLHILEKIKSSYFNKGKHFNNRGENKTNYKPYSQRLKDTTILNRDFKDVIKEYDSMNTFFYLDPPYENTDKSFYNGNTIIDYKELNQILKDLKGKFLMSINDSPYIREQFKDFHIKEVKTRYSDNGTLKTREVVELLISNY